MNRSTITEKYLLILNKILFLSILLLSTSNATQPLSFSIAMPSTGIEMLKSECERGSAQGCRDLGAKYYINSQKQTDNEEINVTKEIESSIKSYTKACELGEFSSCSALGGIYLKGKTKHSFPRNSNYLEEARKLYKKSCDGGYARGCLNLGGIYVSHKNKLKYFSRGCTLGSAISCVRAGTLSQNKISAQSSVKLYTKACDINKIHCHYLGRMYAEGIGVRQNYKTALKYHKESCLGGLSPECLIVGDLYSRGNGSKVNLPMAKEFYGKACDGGMQKGCDEYSILNKKGIKQ